ncbi:pancreatic lipase-related protein 2-like isoform X2, partial [Leptotrombidium deliense]
LHESKADISKRREIDDQSNKVASYDEAVNDLLSNDDLMKDKEIEDDYSRNNDNNTITNIARIGVIRGIIGIITSRHSCFGDYGCFPRETRCFPLIFGIASFPQSPERQRITFIVFTKENQRSGYRISASISDTQVKAAPIQSKRKIVIMTHGYAGGFTESNWMGVTKNLILNKSPDHYTVIIVDWSRGAHIINYQRAKANTRVVGAVIASLMYKLKTFHNTEYESTHLIGHSLGAHVCAYAGQYLKKLTNGKKFGWITGLDPAGPCYKADSVSLNEQFTLMFTYISTSAYLYQVLFEVGSHAGKKTISPSITVTFAGIRRTELFQVNFQAVAAGQLASTLLSIPEKTANGGNPGRMETATIKLLLDPDNLKQLNITKIQVNYMSSITESVRKSQSSVLCPVTEDFVKDVQSKIGTQGVFLYKSKADVSERREMDDQSNKVASYDEAVNDLLGYDDLIKDKETEDYSITNDSIPITDIVARLSGLLGIITNQQSCFGDYGCFQRETNCFSFAFGVASFPQSPESQRITFLVFTKENQNTNGYRISASIPDSEVKAAPIQSKRKIILITHGYASGFTESNWMGAIKNLILNKSPDKYTVIIVDWANGAHITNYQRAKANTRVVGAVIAALMFKMKALHNTDYESTHLIGHSLGAHICGYAGQYLKKITGGEKFGWITGLDPAGPCFYGDSGLFTVVLIVRSDMKFNGNKDIVGDYDIYVNGGEEQKQCPMNIHINLLTIPNPAIRLKEQFSPIFTFFSTSAYLYQALFEVGSHAGRKKIDASMYVTFAGNRRTEAFQLKFDDVKTGDTVSTLLSIPEKTENGGNPGVMETATIELFFDPYDVKQVNITKIYVNYMSSITE